MKNDNLEKLLHRLQVTSSEIKITYLENKKNFKSAKNVNGTQLEMKNEQHCKDTYYNVVYITCTPMQ